MASRTLRQLEDEGAIERQAIAAEQLDRWLDRSHRDLDLAAYATAVEDPERAMTLTYEAGLRACIVLLATAGFRLRSGEGHHRAALEAALVIGGEDLELSISRLDDARRFRNSSLYGTSRPIGDMEMLRLTDDVEALLRTAGRRAGGGSETRNQKRARGRQPPQGSRP